MSATTLEIRSDLKMQLGHLAEESCRVIKRIQEGLAQAQRGEFVTDEEMEAFFSHYVDPQGDFKLQRKNKS